MKLLSRELQGVLLGNGITPFLLTPFLTANNAAEQKYNQIHKRARCTIERSFGQLKRRFRCLGSILRELDRMPSIIVVWYILHNRGLLIEYGPICHIVKLPISMIRPFSLVNNSHITLYPQLEIIWKVSKSLRKYWGKYGQISFYNISCITRDRIIVENIFLA